MKPYFSLPMPTMPYDVAAAARDAKGSGMAYIDFTTLPSKPCSRDDVLSAIRLSRLTLFDKSMSSDYNQLSMGIEGAFKAAEWFDFGRISADDIAQAGEDAKPFLMEGLLRAPYDTCAFRTRLVGEGPEVEIIVLVSEYSLVESPGLRRTNVFCLRTNGARNEWLHLMNGIVIDGHEIRVMGHKATNMAIVTFFEYAGMWSILNTRGVGKEIILPDERLNRARAKAGKPPLGRVVRVDSQRYVTALRQTLKMEAVGQHTDRRIPKMHLRRGHMRTYSDERYVGLRGKRVWIRAMVVGGDLERVANRESYDVKR